MSSLAAKITALTAAAQLFAADAPGQTIDPAAQQKLPHGPQTKGGSNSHAPAPEFFTGEFLPGLFPYVEQNHAVLVRQPPSPAEETSYLPSTGTPTLEQIIDAISKGPPSDFDMAKEYLKPDHLQSKKLLDALMSRVTPAIADVEPLMSIPPEVLADKRLEPFVLASIDLRTNALPMLMETPKEFTPRAEELWFAKALRLLESAEKAGDKAARSDIIGSLTASMSGRIEAAGFIERAIRENPYEICFTVRPFWTEERRTLLLQSVTKLAEDGVGYVSLQNCAQRGTLDYPEIQKYLCSKISTNLQVLPLLSSETLLNPAIRDSVLDALRASTSELWHYIPDNIAADPAFRLMYLNVLNRPENRPNFERASSSWGSEHFVARMNQFPTMYSALLSIHDRGDQLPREESLPDLILVNPRIFSQAIALENTADPAVLAAYSKMVRAYELLKIDNFNHCDNGREIVRQRYSVAPPKIRSALDEILGADYFAGVDSDRRPLAYCFVSKADNNGAIENDSIRRNLNELCGGYRLRLFQVSSREELADAIKTASRNGAEKAELNFVSGHGSRGTVALGRRYWSPVFLSLEDKETFELFKMAAAEGSSFIARACDTGAPAPVDRAASTNAPSGPSNMAEAWHAALPGVRIYAPKLTITDLQLRFDRNGLVSGCSFMMEGKEIENALFNK